MQVELFGQIRWMPVACECEIKQRETEEKAHQLYERQKKIEKYFGISQLGPRFSKATFQSWEQVPGTQTIFKEAVKFAKEQRWLKGEGLLFFGNNTGNGKSHLAAAIVHETIKAGYLAIFQDVPQLLLKLKSTYGKNKTFGEVEIIETLCEADLIVLDDLGAERLTDWTNEKIYSIVNSLYINEKSLIVTTNVDIENEFGEHIGRRINDRIIEMCRAIENKGWSYRAKIAERRLKSE